MLLPSSFLRLPRPIPILARVTTTKYTFLSKFRKEKEQSENFSSCENVLAMFLERKSCSFAVSIKVDHIHINDCLPQILLSTILSTVSHA